MSDDNFLLEIQDSFLIEALENLAQTESLFMSLEKEGVDRQEVLTQIKRLAHNFKGSGKAVGFDDLSAFSHCFENLLGAIANNTVELTSNIVDLLLACNDAFKSSVSQLQVDRKSKYDYSGLLMQIELALSGKSAEPIVATKNLGKKTGSPTYTNASVDDHIRLPMKRIDDLFNSFGEQVIYLSALDHFLDNMADNKDDIARTIFNLKKITFDLQQYTLSLRMVSLKNLFGKLERSVRDAAKTTEKKLKYEFKGTDLELDKIIVDQMSDPLNHMVRNAVDHGLENVEERKSSGKSEEGRIEVSAFREAGSFIIEIKDDGKGIDTSVIRAKAIEKQLITPEMSLAEKELIDLIFEPGFSTKEAVSEISGRGVGMSVVKESIQALNGSYEITTVIGKGTTFRLKLPLSLSLYNGLCFTVQNSRYITPSSQVVEIVNSEDVEIRELKTGTQVVQVRDNVYPLLDLRGLLSRGQNEKLKNKRDRDMILISNIDGKLICFRIHQIIGISKVVQKPINPEMGHCPGAVGVTIMGDGNPVLIVDLRILKSELCPNTRGVVA
jgi:two-component system chemotaxis sensor kinase CheA